MTELVIILGALVILTLWIVGHNIYRWRTDVLTGRYFSSDDQEPAAIAGERTGSASEAAAMRRRTRAFLMGWDADQAQAVPDPQPHSDSDRVDDPKDIDPGDDGATGSPTQIQAPTK
jgi:hypothetical protein